MRPLIHIQVPGKWVLAGEHTVLRGGDAITLPHPTAQLELLFRPSTSEITPSHLESSLQIIPHSSQSIFVDLLNLAKAECHNMGKTFPKFSGSLEIKSSIPISAGLGSSAALSVALTLIVSRQMDLNAGEQFEMARTLENHFHGKSSGMDIAAILAQEPISFSMKMGGHSLDIQRLPNFTFHDTGLRTQTREAVLQVENFLKSNPPLFQKTDEAMKEAVRSCLEGLQKFDLGHTPLGLQILSQGMNRAQDCFKAWGLLPESAIELEKQLLNKGALSVKMTGAGGGGFLVALWPNNAPPLSP